MEHKQQKIACLARQNLGHTHLAHVLECVITGIITNILCRHDFSIKGAVHRHAHITTHKMMECLQHQATQKREPYFGTDSTPTSMTMRVCSHCNTQKDGVAYNIRQLKKESLNFAQTVCLHRCVYARIATRKKRRNCLQHQATQG